jgi:predicted ATPase
MKSPFRKVRGVSGKDSRRGQEAHALLAAVYGRFSEGFDTADLRDAKSLLESL